MSNGANVRTKRKRMKNCMDRLCMTVRFMNRFPVSRSGSSFRMTDEKLESHTNPTFDEGIMVGSILRQDTRWAYCIKKA